MDRKVRFEMSVYGRGRFGDSAKHPLPFKTVYKSRSSTQTGKVSSSQEFRHSGRQRREHDRQLCTPYVRQHSLPAYTGDHRRSNFRTHEVLSMIVMDLHPLNLVEEEGFQNLVKVLHPCSDVPLSASGIRAELWNMYEHTKMKVQQEVSSAKDMVLSAEMWVSSKDLSYLTVSCHYVDENWELKSYVLETAHLLGEHTPQNVHQQLCRISQSWKILEKVQVVVVNVDGMKKHKARWTYIPCFGHTLNKVFFEAMDDLDWRYLLKKCRRVVAFFHQNSEVLRSVQLTQSLGFDWLPVLTMMEKILHQWPSISTEFMNMQVETLWLNENERTMLNSAVEALTTIKNIVMKMGQSGYSPVSNIIPLCDELKASLAHLERHGNKVAQKLAEKCDHHMGGIKQNSWFTVSAALDPRFKSSVLQHFDKIKAQIKEEVRRQGRKATSSSCNKEYRLEDLALQRYFTASDTLRTLNPLEFWANTNSFKELSTVARKYLTVVSTAVPLERFTQQEKSQLIFNRRRCVEQDNVDVMLFLNSNQAKI